MNEGGVGENVRLKMALLTLFLARYNRQVGGGGGGEETPGSLPQIHHCILAIQVCSKTAVS